MPSILTRLKKPALWTAGSLLLVLVFAWLALPGIIQSQAEKFVTEQTGHRLTLARPDINPLALRVHLNDLQLNDPEGQLLLSFRSLLVDLSATSLARRAWVFDAIELDGLQGSLVMHEEGSTKGPLNWSRLLTALQGKDEPTPAAPPPRLDISRLQLRGAQLDLADHRTTPHFVSKIESFDLELIDVSTLPDDTGRFKLSAKTAFGAQLDWQGDTALSPFNSKGHLSLTGLDLSRIAPLLQQYLPPTLGLMPPTGIVALAGDYQLRFAAGQLEGTLDNVTASINQLALKKSGKADPAAPALTIEAIELKPSRFDIGTQQLALGEFSITQLQLGAAPNSPSPALITLDRVALNEAHVDLGQYSATLGALTLAGGHIRVTRNAQGTLDLLTAVKAWAPPPSRTKLAVTAATPAWRYRVDRIGIEGLGLDLRDETLTPTAGFALSDIQLDLRDLSDKLSTALPLKAGLQVKSGGSLSVEGKLTPAEPALDVQLKLDGLALAVAQPFVQRMAALSMRSGTLTADGQIIHNAKRSGFRGGFALKDLRLDEADSTTLFLGLKSLSTRQLDVSPTALALGELTLDGLDAQFLIAKDKTTNFQRILKKDGGDSTATNHAAANDAAAPAKTADNFHISIDRLRFRNSELDFADHSLLFPFGTRIHKLRGSFSGLSSRPGTVGKAGQLELDGEVDDYGLARAVGQVDVFNPTAFMDIHVIFRNVEMTRLTPYSATFAGRKIDSGKLSLDLEYAIKQRQLQSQNKVVIDRLVLGERVESATAKDLPLDLAIALLQDSDGRIDLGLPITGSLDDPQFSYGQIVWKVITNVLGKIVTAPFRALGALFGGGEDKLENVAFEAGSTKLTPPEREKLVSIAGALNKRPALTMAVSGPWSEADRVALQDVQLRRTLLTASGFRGDTKGDPGPISTAQPAIQKALESQFADKFGSTELTALKDGFRRANPGQLEEGVAGKMMSRLSGLLKTPRTLGEDEIGALKGVDFHDVLYQKLREKQPVSDDQLRQLGKERGEEAAAILKGAKAPMNRVSLRDPEKFTGTTHDAPSNIPLKFDLGKAGG